MVMMVAVSIGTYYFHFSPSYGDFVQLLQYLSLVHGILCHLYIYTRNASTIT